MGLELPAAHMLGINQACSSYVKNMDRISRNEGTTQASASPSKNRTANNEPKLLQGIWSSRIAPLKRVSTSSWKHGAHQR